LVKVPDTKSCEDPEAPPVNDDVATGSLQLYLLPTGTIPLELFTGDAVNGAPLQVTLLISLTSGVGLSVTITVNVAPEQLPDVGVTRYVTV